MQLVLRKLKQTLLRLQSDFDENVVAFNRKRINPDACAGDLDSLARGRIELPSVPRTNQLGTVNHAGPERTSTVRAYVIHHGELTGALCDAVSISGALDFRGGIVSRHVGQRTQANLHA